MRQTWQRCIKKQAALLGRMQLMRAVLLGRMQLMSAVGCSCESWLRFGSPIAPGQEQVGPNLSYVCALG